MIRVVAPDFPMCFRTNRGIPSPGKNLEETFSFGGKRSQESRNSQKDIQWLDCIALKDGHRSNFDSNSHCNGLRLSLIAKGS